MDDLDVYLCEPFILPGILPTLGVSTIKAELERSGLKSKIIYPSVTYFVTEKLYKNPLMLSIVEDTPLQLVEYLFVNSERENTALEYIKTSLEKNHKVENIENILILIQRLHDKALNIIEYYSDVIAKGNPKAFCFSTTFGDLNFDLRLIESIKRKNPRIHIICGGSNCDVAYSQKLLSMTNSLDVVICDETGFITAEYIKSIKAGITNSGEWIQYVTTRSDVAKKEYKLKNIDDLPAPNFDDFIEVTKQLKIKTELLTLPYELARGCWWGEMHPCSMCGFFGNQKKYVSKSPKKAVKEISEMIDRYGINQIRFSDLVNPQMDLLEKMMQLEDKSARFFWELRPDLSERHIALLRRFGLTCGQIGIESFSSNELCVIKKGTIGISNICVLRLLSEYKIEVIWNYLYGFTNDTPQWYESIIAIMPSLYHLQPPSARKIWINRFSDLYNESDKSQLVPLGDDAFHEVESQEFDFFFKAKENPEMLVIYQRLIDEIKKWKKAFSQHYSLLAIPNNHGELVIERRYGTENKNLFLNKDNAMVYEYFRNPHSKKDFEETFGKLDIDELLHRFIEERTMVFLDDRYLSIACFPTEYKWTKYYQQPSYAGGKLFEERGDLNGI